MPWHQRVAVRVRRWGTAIADRAREVSLPFFDEVPVYNVAVFFWRSIVDGALTTRASSIAFNFFLALFPAILFIFTLIPYIPIPNFQDELFFLIKSIVPGSVFSAVEDTVEDIITRPRGSLLSLGFFMALIFATNGISSIMSAFDATIHSINRRSWYSQWLISVALLCIQAVLLTLAIALVTGGQRLLDFLLEKSFFFDKFTYYFFSAGKWVIILALFFFAYSFLYYMAPARKSKWRFISAGGTLATILSIALLFGFTFYINNFSQYNKLYGSIGTLLVVLLLIYLFSLVLLIGFELNASIYQAKQVSDDKESFYSRMRKKVEKP